MSISSTNYVDFSYAPETVAGVIDNNAPTVFQKLPITSVGITDNLSTAKSEVIRSDRMTDDLVVVDSEVSGDCNYELSYAPYKPIVTSLFQNGNRITVSASITDVEFATHTFNGTGFTAAGVVPGIWLKMSGFVTNPTYNTYFKVASTTNTTIVVDDPDDILGADETATVTGTVSYIRNGAAAPDTYTLRKDLTPPGGSSSVLYYKGCIVNSMSFTFEPGAILSGSTNFMGRTTEANAAVAEGGTTLTSVSLTDVASYRIMNGVSSLTEVRVSGLPAGTEFSNVNLTVDNQINAAKAIGVLGAAELAAFSLMVNADMEIYFQDLSIYNIYKTAGSFSVDLVIADNPTATGLPAGNVLIISMPKCKFEELSEPVDGKDNFLMESGSFTALRDATNNFMIQACFFDE